jgi:hypothetical protein
LLAATAFWALSGGPGLALELVPGGYGAMGTGAPGEALQEAPAGSPEAASAPALSLDFTPRYAAGSSLGEMPASQGLRFDFTVDADPGDRFEQLGLAEGKSSLYPRNQRGGQTALSVGGAMHWSGFSLGGGYGRSRFMGADVDLFSATIGYGRLSAEFAYGQPVVETETAPRDVLMLNTDLAASSWLTLESGIAVGSVANPERAEDQSVAVGRLGLRLNF